MSHSIAGPRKLIRITTFSNPSRQTVGFQITDEGCGVSPDSLNRVTDPFYTTKRNSGGVGLGLSISSKIIMEHGGSLTFNHGYPKGTVVDVALPVSESGFGDPK